AGAHAVTEDAAAAADFIAKFNCPCKTCDGADDLVRPRVIWQHLADAEKPDPECRRLLQESLRLEGAASLRNIIRSRDRRPGHPARSFFGPPVLD
ncbi:unnamed protein product, partial [Ectocarpus fasciculatus]